MPNDQNYDTIVHRRNLGKTVITVVVQSTAVLVDHSKKYKKTREIHYLLHPWDLPIPRQKLRDKELAFP